MSVYCFCKNNIHRCLIELRTRFRSHSCLRNNASNRWMISVGTVDLNEKIMSIKNWNILIGWNLFRIIASFLLRDMVWCYSLSSTLVTNCFLLPIIRSILYYLTKYGFKGSQLLHISRSVWGCFRHNWENVIYWIVLKQIWDITGRYWSVLKNTKNGLWNKAWHLTSSACSPYRSLTNWQNFSISLFNRNSEGAVNLQLMLFTQSSISLEPLRVCVIVSLPKIFFLMYGSD